MALSGRILTNAWTADSGNTWRVALDWTATQSVENNTSTINWELVVVTPSSSYVVISELRVKFAGEQIYYRNDSNHTNGYNNTVLASGSKVIAHNADGSKSFTASVEAGIYNWAINKSGSGTIALNTIPRASGVTCSTANIGAKPTITISRASSAFTHTLRYEFGTLSDTIVTKTAITAYKNWTIPTTFYAQIPNAQSGTGTIYCDTYNGNTLIGTSSCPFTARADENTSKPTLEPTVVDVDSTTTALTGDANKLIRYYSDAQFTFNAAARNSATLKTTKLVNGGTTSTNASGTIYNVGNGEFNFTVTDSRGYSVTETVTKTLIPYIRLTCDVWKISSSATGDAEIGISGNYFNGSFGATNNTLTVQYRYKTNNGSYGSWTTVTPTISGNEYEATVSMTGMNYQQSYTFQARAVDKLITKASAVLPLRFVPVFDWGADDFNFNVPVTINGDLTVNGSITQSNDHIIETGTASMGSNGTWYWRKWANGRAECYGCRNFGNMGVSTAWGVLYRSEVFSQTLPSGLFTATPEVVDITFRNSNFGAWIAKHETSAPSTSSSGSFIVVRPASATLSQAYISFNVIGRWK